MHNGPRMAPHAPCGFAWPHQPVSIHQSGYTTRLQFTIRIPRFRMEHSQSSWRRVVRRGWRVRARRSCGRLRRNVATGRPDWWFRCGWASRWLRSRCRHRFPEGWRWSWCFSSWCSRRYRPPAQWAADRPWSIAGRPAGSGDGRATCLGQGDRRSRQTPAPHPLFRTRGLQRSGGWSQWWRTAT